MRGFLGLLHRWFGLFTAIFLAISGFTGALISWDHELDAALNPQLYQAKWSRAESPLVLANQLEQREQGLIVSFLPLQHEANHALNLFISPRDAQAKERLDYNQVAINPQSGEIQARRMWGEISLARENLLPFLYKLHYTLHLPDIGSLETGMLFMGIVGIVWALDCFVALAISFPSWRSWKKSFTFRFRRGAYKLNFDLHRSGGVWLWALLLVLAVTSISMNLGFQVVRPLVNAISPLTPSPFETTPYSAFSSPAVTREQVLVFAEAESKKHNINKPLGGIFYSTDFNIYGVGYFEPGNSHGDGGLGNAWLYFSGDNGDFIGSSIPGEGSAGDIFMQAQFPLHSGRIIGVWGRALMSFLGVFVGVLSITGIVIWVRKRRVRVVRAEKSQV